MLTQHMCQGVKDAIFCREVMVAVQMEVLVGIGGFPVNRG